MAIRTERVGPLVVDIHEPEGESRLTLLYSHGFGSVRNGEKVLHLGAALTAAGATLIAPDLQGHGESGGSFGAITLKRSISDLLSCTALPAFRDAPRRLLGGSSFGALTALWTTIENPGLAERLFLLAPAFRFIERHHDALTPEEQAQVARGEPLRVEKEWFSVDLEADIFLERNERTMERLVAELAVPALIVHGKHDETVPLDVVFDFVRASNAPGLELHVVGDGDHRLTDHKELLARELLRFAMLD
ncbi:MAG: alpha/beta hydrolase [Planctomycetota bacterium]